MTEFIPFLSGIVTILFAIAFYFGLQEAKEIEDE